MASGPSAARATAAETSPPVSSKTIQAPLSSASGRLGTPASVDAVATFCIGRPLKVVLCSPRFPAGYLQPVWRIADALEKIKILLKIRVNHHEQGNSGIKAKGVTVSELKAVFLQLEIIEDVLQRFYTDFGNAVTMSRTLALAVGSLVEEENPSTPKISLLFELLNYDDMIKDMYHFPPYVQIIYHTIIFHLSDVKLHLSRRKIHANHTVFSSFMLSEAPTHSTTANSQRTEAVDFLTKQIKLLQHLIDNADFLFTMNGYIKDLHTKHSQMLQSKALASLREHSRPTRQLLKNLSRALQILRSAKFLREDDGVFLPTIDELKSQKDAYYRELLPLIKKAKTHLQLIEELGLNRDMDINKDAALPFYLELVRFTRGTVDESPLSKLSNERGLGMGNGSSLESLMGNDTGGSGRLISTGSEITRRHSLSSGSMFKGGFRDVFMEWMRKHDGEEGKGKQRGLKGMWTKWKEGAYRAPISVISSQLPDETSGGANSQENNSPNHKTKTTSPQESFFAFSISSPSSKQQNSTDTLGIPSSGTTKVASNHMRSLYGGNHGGKEKGKGQLCISEDHRAVLDEWEDFATMVNAQKCMCKTGWMVGGIQHLRGREGRTTALGHVSRDAEVQHDDNQNDDNQDDDDQNDHNQNDDNHDELADE